MIRPLIRRVVDADLPVLQEIERAAGEAFRTIGMPEIADDEPLPLGTLAAYAVAGRAWVAADADDRPVAYLIADVVDGKLHIEQVSVHPRAARRGIGRDLIEHAAGYARDHALPALTLTTFTEVPWNAPYYERCGFQVLPDPGPGLRALIHAEVAHGLARWPRVPMHRPLPR